MSSKGEVARFNDVAIYFHWIVAALIFANILIAWQFSWVRGPTRLLVFQLHRSIGITVLLLSVMRLSWRAFTTLPPFPETMRNWEKETSKLVERSLYVLMLALPLTGWAIASASDPNMPIMLYGIAHWPDIPVISTLPPDWKLQAYVVSVKVHHLLTKITYALIALHVLSALRHQYIKRDYILARMIPFLAPRQLPAHLRRQNAAVANENSYVTGRRIRDLPTMPKGLSSSSNRT